MNKIIVTGIFAFVFSGCAAMEADFRNRTCHYDGGYEVGVNDAQAGKPMNKAAVTHYCEESTKADTSRGYTEGYMTIKKNPVININTQQSQAAPRCRAKQGQEVFANFCGNLNEFNCGAHSNCSLR